MSYNYHFNELKKKPITNRYLFSSYMSQKLDLVAENLRVDNKDMISDLP